MKLITLTLLLLFISKLTTSQTIPAPYQKKPSRKIIEKQLMMTFDTSYALNFNNLLNLAPLNASNATVFSLNPTFKMQLNVIDSFYKQKSIELKKWRDDSLKKILDLRKTDPNNYSRSKWKTDKEQIISEYHSSNENLILNKFDEYEVAYETWTDDNWFRLFPARNRVCASQYFNSRGDKVVESLKNGFLNFDNNSGSIYSELIAGYGGPFRLSFGGMIAASKTIKLDSTIISETPPDKLDSLINSVDSTNKVNSSIQRLIGGGGNSILTFSTPIIDIHDNENIFKYSIIVFDKFCLDIPALSAQSAKVSLVNGYGLESNANYSLDKDNTFGLFTTFRLTFINGTNQFYDNLELSDKETLLFSELNVGIYVYQFRIFLNKAWLNNPSFDNQLDWTVGISIIPFTK